MDPSRQEGHPVGEKCPNEIQASSYVDSRTKSNGCKFSSFTFPAYRLYVQWFQLHLPPYGIPSSRGPPPMYHPSMRCMTLPSHHFNPAMFPPPPQPPASLIYPDGSVGFPSTLRGSTKTSSKQRGRSLGRKDPKKRQRQRRQSDENLTFTYTGLDRTIADEFLGRQEQSHHGSEISGNGRKENRTDVALWMKRLITTTKGHSK